jgi:hypothetical protein
MWRSFGDGQPVAANALGQPLLMDGALTLAGKLILSKKEGRLLAGLSEHQLSLVLIRHIVRRPYWSRRGLVCSGIMGDTLVIAEDWPPILLTSERLASSAMFASAQDTARFHALRAKLLLPEAFSDGAVYAALRGQETAALATVDLLSRSSLGRAAPAALETFPASLEDIVSPLQVFEDGVDVGPDETTSSKSVVVILNPAPETFRTGMESVTIDLAPTFRPAMSATILGLEVALGSYQALASELLAHLLPALRRYGGVLRFAEAVAYFHRTLTTNDSPAPPGSKIARP